MSRERTPGQEGPDNQENPTAGKGRDGSERNGNEGKDGKQGGNQPTPAKPAA